MRSKRSARLSVISIRSQLREYSRRTRRADGEHCLLLVWIGLQAKLLLCSSATFNTGDSEEMALSTLLCAHCCYEWNNEDGLAGTPDLSLSGMLVGDALYKPRGDLMVACLSKFQPRRWCTGLTDRSEE